MHYKTGLLATALVWSGGRAQRQAWSVGSKQSPTTASSPLQQLQGEKKRARPWRSKRAQTVQVVEAERDARPDNLWVLSGLTAAIVAVLYALDPTVNGKDADADAEVDADADGQPRESNRNGPSSKDTAKEQDDSSATSCELQVASAPTAVCHVMLVSCSLLILLLVDHSLTMTLLRRFSFNISLSTFLFQRFSFNISLSTFTDDLVTETALTKTLSTIDLSFSDIALDLTRPQSKGGSRAILDGSLRGRARPGRLLAIM
jgi:hypothetical protein